ncbi:MAG: AbrB family transcriptional regulator [Thermosynechococcaceae cyanobacterium]
MATKNETQALTGKALLQKLTEIPSLSRREKARECGYVNLAKGKPRVNIGAFLNAVLDAKGIPVGVESEKNGRGREANYRVSVHKNGQIVLGPAYTQKMGLKFGDVFEIKLGYKHIHLKQVGSDGETD